MLPISPKTSSVTPFAAKVHDLHVVDFEMRIGGGDGGGIEIDDLLFSRLHERGPASCVVSHGGLLEREYGHLAHPGSVLRVWRVTRRTLPAWVKWRAPGLNPSGETRRSIRGAICTKKRHTAIAHHDPGKRDRYAIVLTP